MNIDEFIQRFHGRMVTLHDHPHQRAHHEEEPITNRQKGKLLQLKVAKGEAFIGFRLTEVLGLGHESVAIADLTQAQANALIAKIAFYDEAHLVDEEPIQESKSITITQIMELERFRTAKGPGYMNARMVDTVGNIKDMGSLSELEAIKLLTAIKNNIRWREV